MKILITTDTYAPAINGVVTSIKNLKNALTEQGHEVRILTLASNSDFEGYHNSVYYLRSFKCGIYPDARVTLAFWDPILRAIEYWSPDVIHSQTEFSSFLCAKHLAKKLSIPLVHTYHTLYEDYTHYFCPNQVLGTLAARYFTRMISKSVSLICAPSVKVRRVLMDYGVQAPVAVLPTGITLDRFRNPVPDSQIDAMKRAHGLPENSRVLLSLGRLAAEKNYDGLLETISPILKRRADTYFVIVGDGPHRPALEEKVHSLGLSDKVRFTGMVSAEEVPAYYKLGDIFICASSSETQGLTYLEAMASGLPQVVYHDDCLQGVISQGENGYTFRTATECTSFLDELLTDEEKRLAMSACALSYARRFDIEVFGSRAATCYEALSHAGQAVAQTVFAR